jgi:hypothetical protein
VRVCGYIVICIDIANAFLEGDLEEINYIYLAEDLTNFLLERKLNGQKTKIRVKLNKNLYGTKHAAKSFNDKLNRYLLKNGFKRLANDVCFYTYNYNNDILIAGR